MVAETHERLQEARKKAGFETASDAARAFGWNEITYRAHENATRGLRRPMAERYAKAFRIKAEWLIFGKPGEASEPQNPATVPLTGYVRAGSEAHFFGRQGFAELERVPAPDSATEETVALEIRSDSLGAIFKSWLLFYDEVRRPVTPDLIGKLCVVGLDEGRILVKKIQRSRARGLYHLVSQTESPILDVAVDWAARVKSMAPR